MTGNDVVISRNNRQLVSARIAPFSESLPESLYDVQLGAVDDVPGNRDMVDALANRVIHGCKRNRDFVRVFQVQIG
jgi:hypothetical protein